MHYFNAIKTYRLVELQVAKNNRLMVYRQTVKHEIAKADDDGESLKSRKTSVAPVSVGGKKLVIKPCASSATPAAVAETKPKLLLLGPVKADSKKCDKDVDNDDNNNNSNKDIKKTDNSATLGENVDSSITVVSVNDLNSVGATVDIECCTKEIAAVDDGEPAQQTADVTVPQKGRKTGKKSASTGRKGNISLFFGNCVRSFLSQL